LVSFTGAGQDNLPNGQDGDIIIEPVVTIENGITTISIPATEIPEETGARVIVSGIATKITLSRIDTNRLEVSVISAYPLTIMNCSYWIRMYSGNILQINTNKSYVGLATSGLPWVEIIYCANWNKAEIYNINVGYGIQPSDYAAGPVTVY
jgi:hypothetical protein